MKEIQPNGIYTSIEVQELLKISSSTFKRLVKKGLLRANKVGGQYRILGHEILRTVSPDVDRRATNAYQEVKKKTKKIIQNW